MSREVREGKDSSEESSSRMRPRTLSTGTEVNKLTASKINDISDLYFQVSLIVDTSRTVTEFCNSVKWNIYISEMSMMQVDIGFWSFFPDRSRTGIQYPIGAGL